MQDKNKKNILSMVALLALALLIVSLFLPVLTLDYSTILEKNGYNKPDLYWRMDKYFAFIHYSVYDKRDVKNQSEFHRYKFFNFFIIETGDHSIKDEFSPISTYEKTSTEQSYLFTEKTAAMTWFVFGIVTFLLCLFFCYRGIRYCTVKKTKDFLFLFIIGLIFSFVYITLNYFSNDFADVNNLGYNKYMTFEFGFYLFYLSIFLFFVVFIVQNYFLDLPKETDIIIK